MSDELQINGDTSDTSSEAYYEHRRLRENIVLEIDNPCDEGSTVLSVELLEDCPYCKGKYKTLWGTCEACVFGLVPNKSGRSVLFLMEKFLLPAGFKRKDV